MGSTWDHGDPIFGCFEDCEADIWCRIFDGDGSQVRTSVNWNNRQASFANEPLTVTLTQSDIIDVKCWDEDGANDDSNRRLVLVQMRQRVLGAVVVGVIV